MGSGIICVMPMRKVQYRELLRLLEKQDPVFQRLGPDVVDDTPLREALDEYFSDKEESKAVLGIDIYQYSKMPLECQRLIPTLFKFLRDISLGICHDEEFMFAAHPKNGLYISTGDGGFEIFDTPLHAIVFAIHFQSVLVTFNGFLLHPRLRSMLGQISVRYALTYNTLFRQNSNFFGPGIITNARILARDALNRFLVDANTVEWFQRYLYSLESLQTIRAADLRHVMHSANAMSPRPRSLLFGRRGRHNIESVDLQKVGFVSVKGADLDIYNLCVKTVMTLGSAERKKPVRVVTVGNLNTSGITV